LLHVITIDCSRKHTAGSYHALFFSVVRTVSVPLTGYVDHSTAIELSTSMVCCGPEEPNTASASAPAASVGGLAVGVSLADGDSDAVGDTDTSGSRDVLCVGVADGGEERDGDAVGVALGDGARRSMDRAAISTPASVPLFHVLVVPVAYITHVDPVVEMRDRPDVDVGVPTGCENCSVVVVPERAHDRPVTPVVVDVEKLENVSADTLCTMAAPPGEQMTQYARCEDVPAIEPSGVIPTLILQQASSQRQSDETRTRSA
jgi:hypothetical protein